MVSEELVPQSFTKRLDHLGIIAALVEGLGIVDLVDARLPKLRHHTLTHGDVVLALILNGLGFTQRRLYLFAAWFENKPLKRLFGKEVTAADFTDDVIGRTLDAIKEYGPERLYQEIISQIFLVTQLGYHQVHLDTTNFSVHGAYDTPDTSRIGRGCHHPTPFQEPYVHLSAHTARAFHYPFLGRQCKESESGLYPGRLPCCTFPSVDEVLPVEIGVCV